MDLAKKSVGGRGEGDVKIKFLSVTGHANLMSFVVTCSLLSTVGIELMSLLAFPIKFLEEISEQAEVHWHFGWGYWVGWASAIFIFVSGLLLVIDKDAEELVYREITSKKKQLGSDEETEAV